MMRRFIVLRPNPPENYLAEGLANHPDEIQFEGVVFADGTCVVRWRTEYKSHSVWDSFESLYKVHGHLEYGTEVIFLDDAPDIVREFEGVTSIYEKD